MTTTQSFQVEYKNEDLAKYLVFCKDTETEDIFSNTCSLISTLIGTENYSVITRRAKEILKDREDGTMSKAVKATFIKEYSTEDLANFLVFLKDTEKEDKFMGSRITMNVVVRDENWKKVVRRAAEILNERKN